MVCCETSWKMGLLEGDLETSEGLVAPLPVSGAPNAVEGTLVRGVGVSVGRHEGDLCV